MIGAQVLAQLWAFQSPALKSLPRDTSGLVARFHSGGHSKLSQSQTCSISPLTYLHIIDVLLNDVMSKRTNHTVNTHRVEISSAASGAKLFIKISTRGRNYTCLFIMPAELVTILIAMSCLERINETRFDDKCHSDGSVHHEP